MELNQSQLARLIGAAIELGEIIALVRSAQLKPYLKKKEAYRLYGRGNVEHWIEAALLKPRKDGDHSAAWRIDRIELEILRKASELERCFSEARRPQAQSSTL